MAKRKIKLSSKVASSSDGSKRATIGDGGGGGGGLHQQPKVHPALDDCYPLNKLCRLCLLSNTSMEPIFAYTGDIELSQRIFQCTGLEVIYVWVFENIGYWKYLLIDPRKRRKGHPDIDLRPVQAPVGPVPRVPYALLEEQRRSAQLESDPQPEKGSPSCKANDDECRSDCPGRKAQDQPEFVAKEPSCYPGEATGQLQKLRRSGT